MPPVIALIGDPSPEVRAHRAIPRAAELCASVGGPVVELRWFPTNQLGAEPAASLRLCGGVWCVPGSPYANMDAALAAIRFTREHNVPFLGTCGGCQHAIIEFARSVLGLTGADHEETNPTAPTLVVTRLARSLVGRKQTLRVRPGSHLHAAVGLRTTEGYHCKYGPSLAHPEIYCDRALRVTATDEQGQPRAFELGTHPWFVATLFQPELTALSGKLHPLIAAFFRMAAGAKG